MTDAGPRKVAPHVQAAMARGAGTAAQGKLDRQGVFPTPAPHVRAALARAVQPRPRQPPIPPAGPALAPHVRAAVTAGVLQPRGASAAGGPHVPPRAGGAQRATVLAPPVVQAAARRSESCEATLYIGGRRYDGATGRGHGHAEMDALHDFVEAMGGVEEAVAALGRYKSLKVRCESRPVCSQCGAVLQALGFELYSEETEWGDKTMGSTEWAVSMNVKALLAEVGIDVKEILRMRKGYAL